MKSTVGKVSAIMILLTFILVSMLVLNVALAQNETFEINITENNASEIITANVSIDNNETHVFENVTINDTDDNKTFSEGPTVENNLLNESVENVTLIQNETSNETSLSNLTNVTNETIDIPPIKPVIDPTFNVNLVYPQKITRGESITIRADLTSDVFAKSVYLKWILPQGMQIVSGNQIETCGDIDSSTGCTSEINIDTTQSALGLEEIKVVVAYEK